MKKIIIAIGGGENGRIDSNGKKMPYETKEIDYEIVRLTNKKNPHFLFLGHSQNNDNKELSYFKTMQLIYGNIFGCECKILQKSDLTNNTSNIKFLIDWADIIYEGGGDTKGMIELWQKTGFNKTLFDAWNQGKILCGISAGANCWFESCSSDSLKIQLNDDNAPMINVDCLNFVSAFFTPHCNIVDNRVNRLAHMKESLKNSNLIGIGISNCCALEIIDNKYVSIIFVH